MKTSAKVKAICYDNMNWDNMLRSIDGERLEIYESKVIYN